MTAILPHAGNLFRDKAVAAVDVINAFGKPTGLLQVAELGVIETPIVLTNTLSGGTAFEGLVEHALAANPEIGVTTGSVNPVVAECNDGYLNDIRGRHVHVPHVLAAIESAAGGPVAEGVVGAGTGMSCYGWKGGIGTASRRVTIGDWRATLGVLVLANFGTRAELVIGGVPVGEFFVASDELREAAPDPESEQAGPNGGSCVIVLATDAPASSRQLTRIARRARFGLAWTGTYSEHGSGEFVIAFSTARTVPHWPRGPELPHVELAEDGPTINALFLAAAEATAEAITNALFTGVSTTGADDHVRLGLPVDTVRALVYQRDELLLRARSRRPW